MAYLNPMVGNAKGGVGDGANQKPRSGKTGELNVGRLHGPYAEAVMRGNTFNAQVGTAGVAPGTAISTTPPITLWNPPNSGIWAVIYRLTLSYISGTLGAGEMLYLQNPQTTKPSGGTQIVPVNCLLGNGSAPKCTAHSASTVAATPSLICSTGIVLGAFLGGAGNVVPPVADNVDGAITIYPGNAVSVQDHVGNAGTSPKVDLGLAWEEVPIT